MELVVCNCIKYTYRVTEWNWISAVIFENKHLWKSTGMRQTRRAGESTSHNKQNQKTQTPKPFFSLFSEHSVDLKYVFHCVSGCRLKCQHRRQLSRSRCRASWHLRVVPRRSRLKLVVRKQSDDVMLKVLFQNVNWTVLCAHVWNKNVKATKQKQKCQACSFIHLKGF